MTRETARPVALVTGGPHRIGAAIATDLAANGFLVAVHYGRSRQQADALCAAIGNAGGRAEAFQADLTDRTAVGQLAPRVTDALGPIALLVNNASIFEDDRATSFGWESWDRHFAVHLEAPAMLARQMAQALPPETDGLVVNIIDQRVWRLTPNFFSYTLSKSALWTATRTMAQALAPRVRVNAIGPGPTLMNDRQSEADFQRQVDGLILERGPELDEFGATIRYLWQAKSVTGQMIALDGGQHLAWETPDIYGIAE